MTSPPGTEIPPRHLVLYDGECGVCSRIVRWLIDTDRRGLLRFAPLQGVTANELRQRWHDLPTDLDSVVYVERSSEGERVSWRSEAFFRLCRVLGGPWRAVAALEWLPRPLTDAAYKAFARRRHLFGAPPACGIPSPAERARFLP